MTEAASAKFTMRWGVRSGVTAVVLLVLGPFINRNLGVGDSLSTMTLPEPWETASTAVLATLLYLVLVAISVLLSAALITVSVVIRHSDANRRNEAGQRTHGNISS